MSDAEKPFGNKLVVVTGAGSGIGRATALGFAANGATIVAADLDLAAATAAGELITARGGTAHARQVDVSAAADMERFASWVRTELGVPDVVVNNAGIAIVGPLLAHTEEDWQRIIGVNLLGVVRGCRLFGTQMAERGRGGHLVNIASAAAYAPSASLPAYAATKAGVRMFSECLRAELAPAGIGVTAICPGFTSTPIARAARYVGLPAGEEERVRENSVRALRRRRFPPEKVALAVMRAVLRGRPVVPGNAQGRGAYALSRLAPGPPRAPARAGAGACPGRARRARPVITARRRQPLITRSFRGRPACAVPGAPAGAAWHTRTHRGSTGTVDFLRAAVRARRRRVHQEGPGHPSGEPLRRPAGTLEAEVLAVLRAAGTSLTPGEVRGRLEARQRGELSYSTVVTIMSRLHGKGLLARERAGRGFAYTPVDAASLAAGQMSRALDGGA